MEKSVALIRILCAFPGDVADEATALDGIAIELNRTIGEIHSVRFEVLNWLRDVRAGMADDSQSVINEQLGDNYEVIVATFWSRAGTPTPRAESGSIEEVKTAIRRAKASRALPYVLIYMKTMGVNPLQSDPEQIRILHDFRTWLREQGVLYKPFPDKASFEALLRLDLAKVAAQFVQRPGVEAIAPPEHAEIPLVEDDLGLLDYIDIREAAFARMTELMEDQGTLLGRLTVSLAENTSEANLLTSGNADRNTVRRLLKKQADSWELFCSESEAKLIEIQNKANEAFDSMTRALSLKGPSNEAERAHTLSQLRGMATAASQTAVHTRTLRDSIGKFPRMTAEHNRARRKVVDLLDRWSTHIENVSGLALKVADSVEQISL